MLRGVAVHSTPPLARRRLVEALYSEGAMFSYAVKAILMAIQGSKPEAVNEMYGNMLDAWWPSKARLLQRAEEVAPLVEHELGRNIGVMAREEDAASVMDDLRTGGFWDLAPNDPYEKYPRYEDEEEHQQDEDEEDE